MFLLALQIMESHRKFLQKSLAGTILKSKMVRNLTELKVLVYDFSKQSEGLVIDEADFAELETPKRQGKATEFVQNLETVFSYRSGDCLLLPLKFNQLQWTNEYLTPHFYVLRISAMDNLPRIECSS